MERSSSKAERLLQLEQLLLAFPEGLHRAEIARRLGVHRATAGRYIEEVGRHIPIWQDGNLFGINRDDYLTHVRLTIHESMAVHLAARLMATRTDKHNPHAAAALRKLGQALEGFAPLISQHLLASAEVMDDAARRHDPVYLEVLETLTRAWSQGRMVHLWHKHKPSGRVYEYDFAPYFIEPYAVGQTTHVIGWREPPKAVRTFKLERVQRIELTNKPYTIPADFDPRETLADAWGIWYTEAEPVEVVLIFHPRVAQRVQETRWHRNEQTEEQPDGSLIWRARVAEPQEMLPWIRGWGADVTVMKPEELREKLVKGVKRMALLYQVGNVEPLPLYQRLWAKANRKTGQIHPLICHTLDVALVAQTMWNEAFTTSLRRQMAETLGTNEEEAGRTLAFWAGLHDLGKATPAFQRKYSPAEAELKQAGLKFARQFGRESFHHGAATAFLLPDLLQKETCLSQHIAFSAARAVGGHHGSWPTADEILELREKPYLLGDEEWQKVRRVLFRKLRDILQPAYLSLDVLDRKEHNSFWTFVSGFVSVADWIGSMENYFPHADIPLDVEQYAAQAQHQARRALEELNWTAWSPPTEEVPFTALFNVPAPRPMQEQVIALAEKLDRPALVIIEAPTGVGKTEAALYLADHWARILQQRGLYIAMPTMATSNQMYTRVSKVLARRYPNLKIAPLLVHSQARWQRHPPQMEIVKQEPGKSEDEDDVEAMSWFLPRKRSLLAPLGVGTVDQTLLSVLQTRHFFVRLFGLSHKTVIFDEAHAYDTYMSELFQRLLSWLRLLGTSVVILSATLSAKTRRELLQAYAGAEIQLPPASYPAITYAMEGEIGLLPVAAPQNRPPIEIGWLEQEPQAIVACLEEKLRNGGCAAVICNTVGRTQELYRALTEAQLVDEDDLILFHARFPFGRRQEIERKVLARFDKESSQRPYKAIVVATQVIEQSLDLDFDLMISDLAPVDFLIQRAGRLHRHQRERRPIAQPRLWITIPPLKDDSLPVFARSDTYIYDRYVLLRSYLALRDHSQLALPGDTVPLIEAVYGDGPVNDPHLAQLLKKTQREMEKQHEEKSRKAREKMIASPNKDDVLRKNNQGLEEENPELHDAFRALTRLGPPTISLVCLHRVGKKLNTAPDGTGMEVSLSQYPGEKLTRALVEATVTVSHWKVVSAHLKRPRRPAAWRKHPLLKRYYLAEFTNGKCKVTETEYTLYLSHTLGLEIKKDA